MVHYTVAIASSTRVAGTTTTLAKYNIDWGFLPDNKAFKVSFSIITDKVNVSSYQEVAVLTADLGQSNSYRTDYFSSRGTATQFLGGLIPTITGTNGTSSFLFADLNTNASIYFNNRPHNNLFDVGIYSLETGLPWTDTTGGTIDNYGLTLTFTVVD